MCPIVTDVHGVKCDNPGCGWSDMTVPRSNLAAWRNARCPRCAANLLTDADWKTLRRIECAIAALNLLLFWVKPPKPTGQCHRTSVLFDGTGKVTIVDGKD